MNNNETVDYLELYEKNIQGFCALPNKVIVDLITKAQNGDENARNKVINHNLKFVLFIAKMFEKTGEDTLNLASYANEALIGAIKNFDVNSSTKFITYLGKYVYWYIKRNIIKEKYVYGSSTIDNLERIKKYCDNFLMTNEREALDDEIIRDLKVKKDVVSLYKSINNSSLNIFDIDQSEQLSIEDKNIENVINNTTREFLINKITNSRLSDKAKFILLYRYGFIDDETHSLEEIGSLYNLSRQRVKGIEQKALDRLRLTIRR